MTTLKEMIQNVHTLLDLIAKNNSNTAVLAMINDLKRDQFPTDCTDKSLYTFRVNTKLIPFLNSIVGFINKSIRALEKRLDVDGVIRLENIENEIIAFEKAFGIDDDPYGYIDEINKLLITRVIEKLKSKDRYLSYHGLKNIIALLELLARDKRHLFNHFNIQLQAAIAITINYSTMVFYIAKALEQLILAENISYAEGFSIDFKDLYRWVLSDPDNDIQVRKKIPNAIVLLNIINKNISLWNATVNDQQAKVISEQVQSYKEQLYAIKRLDQFIQFIENHLSPFFALITTIIDKQIKYINTKVDKRKHVEAQPLQALKDSIASLQKVFSVITELDSESKQTPATFSIHSFFSPIKSDQPSQEIIPWMKMYVHAKPQSTVSIEPNTPQNRKSNHSIEDHRDSMSEIKLYDDCQKSSCS